MTVCGYLLAQAAPKLPRPRYLLEWGHCVPNLNRARFNITNCAARLRYFVLSNYYLTLLFYCYLTLLFYLRETVLFNSYYK